MVSSQSTLAFDTLPSTEMRWRALQASRVYINQHPRDARLTLDELKDMVGSEGERFAN